MARRVREFTVVQEGERENRDVGKTYIITEVSAVAAEEWGLRAMMALGSSGITVPQSMVDAGFVGAALVFYQAFMGANEVAVLPLWREMIPACVKLQQGEGIRMAFEPSMVEEVSTLMKLREQIMELHTGFTLAELARQFQRGAIIKRALQTTSTSQEPSEPS